MHWMTWRAMCGRPHRTRAQATERCVCRTGSGKMPTHASALGNAPSAPVTNSSVANLLFFPFVGLDGSCAAMSRSFSSVLGYRRTGPHTARQ